MKFKRLKSLLLTSLLLLGAAVLLVFWYSVSKSEKIGGIVRRLIHRSASPLHAVKERPNGSRPPLALLRRGTANGRYFTGSNGRSILLAGDHTWYTLQDSSHSNPPETFPYLSFLSFLEAHRVNFLRSFVWEQAKWSVGLPGPYCYDPLPYKRTGPDEALDGKLKFDLSQFNQQYFDRLRERLIQAGERGIYVSVQLFQGFSVQSKPFMSANNPWPGHPFNKLNNINQIDGDLNGNGQGEETETLSIPAITALQEKYVDKVIDTLNDLDNVLFEICNEAQSSSQDWQEHMIQHIHRRESSRPKQHPVGMTVEWPNGSNSELFTSSADWVSPNGDNGYFTDPPVSDGSKVVITDTDHLWGIGGSRAWMWKSFLRGNNLAFMDPYDCRAEWSPSGWLGCNPNDAVWANIRANLGYILEYSKRIDLNAAAPRPELTSTGYCLAKLNPTAAEYITYLPAGRTLRTALRAINIRRNVDIYLPWDGMVTVDLSATPRALSVEWFDPKAGVKQTHGTVMGGCRRDFKSPFANDSVLYLYEHDHRPEEVEAKSL